MVRKLLEKAEGKTVQPSELTYRSKNEVALILGRLTEQQIIAYCREIYRDTFNADLNVGSFITGHKKYTSEQEALQDFVTAMIGSENIAQRKLMIGVALVSSNAISEQQARQLLESQGSPEELGYNLTPEVMREYLQLRRPENYDKFSGIRDRIIPRSRLTDYNEAAGAMRQKTIDFLSILAGISMNGTADMPRGVVIDQDRTPTREDIRYLWRTSVGLSAYWNYISQDRVSLDRYMTVMTAIERGDYEEVSVGELIRALAFFTQFGREIKTDKDIDDLFDEVNRLRGWIDNNVMVSGGSTDSGYMQYITIAHALNSRLLRSPEETIRTQVIERVNAQYIPALQPAASYSEFLRLLGQVKSQSLDRSTVAQVSESPVFPPTLSVPKQTPVSHVSSERNPKEWAEYWLGRISDRSLAVTDGPASTSGTFRNIGDIKQSVESGDIGATSGGGFYWLKSFSKGSGGALKDIGIPGQDNVVKPGVETIETWKQLAIGKDAKVIAINGVEIKTIFIFSAESGAGKMPNGMSSYHLPNDKDTLIVVTDISLSNIGREKELEEANFHELHEAYWINVLFTEAKQKNMVTELDEQKMKIIQSNAHIVTSAEESIAFGDPGENRLTPFHERQINNMSDDLARRLQGEYDNRYAHHDLVGTYLGAAARAQYINYEKVFKANLDRKLKETSPVLSLLAVPLAKEQTEMSVEELATETATKLSEHFAGQRSLIEISNGTYATILILDAIASIFPQQFFSKLKGLKIGGFLSTISGVFLRV